MQSLGDQLLKSGWVTEQQLKRVGDKSKKNASKRRKAVTGADRSGKGVKDRSSAASRRGLSSEVRAVDLSDPSTLKISQAVERHRVRAEIRGEESFHFVLRDGRVRKMLVSKEVSAGLRDGHLAIVEHGDQERHAIVVAEAIQAIGAVDRDAIRFFNS